ncbi:MAG: hypothetical protein KJ871_00715 [Alphaproteobacteria bacterium]|nr:hypothetical protein [Alphaproteobacteria bacterium]MBU2083697.1 hypothetical protein [Alphaproteobacteria bacterium]MBU2143342.1 hypothetical protein [Alphaproteobacteria bacterium]MBU2195163.1 hypothetical protein [Alphaproteobacteria bacterium]
MSEYQEPAGVKTPWHLWLVGGLSLLWNGFGCVDFTMTATRNAAYLEPYPQEMLDYWLNMPTWMWADWAVGVFGGLLGSIALLLRRKLAVPLFAASFIAASISMSFGFLDENAPRMEGAGLMSGIIIVIALLLAVYAWWMSRRDVLR